ncbi:MAG: type II secretion system F family protein [Candidatus Micrarchaeota archaeon]
MEEKTVNRSIFYQPAEFLSHRIGGDLKGKLRLAGIEKTPIEFMEDTLKKTILVGVVLTLLCSIVVYISSLGFIWLALIVPLSFITAFNYLLLYPDATIEKRKKELDYEIVFAGRHILIALKSGMPLFDTFVSTSVGYGAVSREIKKIVDKIIVGVPPTQAIREVAQETPSKYFSRVMIQISNSLASGADVGNSMEAVLDQISKEQVIQLKEYSQKLTPTVMFYMLFGIIVPSIGVVLGVAFVSVLSGGKSGYDASLLIPVMMIIALIQFLFLGVIESTRPRYLV